MHTFRTAGAAALALLLACPSPARAEGAACPAAGDWLIVTETGRTVTSPPRVFAALARRPVVLLGENHDSAEHHRWQLHTIAALHARVPKLVLGFEMFPRRAQSALDQWSAGELSEAQFLERTQWSEVWGLDPALYMPIFHFARMHRIPMLALNVDRQLVRRIGDAGWESVPLDQREGVGDPEPPARAYLALLYQSYLEHLPANRRPDRETSEADWSDPEFRRFVQSMQLWDRAMAEAVAQRLAREPGVSVVAVMGSGHLRDGYGVPHQLRALGVRDAAVALPWDVDDDCASLTAGAADLFFAVSHPDEPAAERPRLGVRLDTAAAGVVVQEVVAGSIAQAAGVRAGDIVKTIAGLPVRDLDDVLAAVRRQAPGTWLPITVQRGDTALDLVARFPPRP